MANKPKLKVCKQCKVKFIPLKPLQCVCGFKCSIAYTQSLREKNNRLKQQEMRKELREAKNKAKSLTELLDEAQKPFNKYIKLRDAHLPCISCGTTKNVQYAAGHYRTVKSASQLRFNEDNVHKQCNSYCNRNLSGNIINYRPALIEKIGLHKVEALECNNEVKRWTIEEAKAIKAKYSALCKQLEKENKCG